MKILSIFNTFNAGKNESDAQIQGYIDGLTSILMQRGVDQDVVLSSCLNTTATRNQLMDVFAENIFYSFVDELHPVTVTFNLTCQKMTQLRGEYDAYLYIDSGITFQEEHQLAHLVHIHHDHNSGMTAAMVDIDGGYFEGLRWGKYIDDLRDVDKHFKNGVFKLPIGASIALHCQLFCKEMYDYYEGQIYPTIFAGHASETVLTHLCASFNKPWILTNDVQVKHTISLDGGSAGFDPAKWVQAGNSRFEHPYLVPSVIEPIRKGASKGLGYMEHQNIIVSDKTKFDVNQNALDPTLKEYIKDNLFVPKHLLDYNKIKHQLIQL